jgi:Imidazolonepropionase and related amidohydrolases
MKGTYADILIVDENPLEDISMVSDHANHQMVLKNGTPVSKNSNP